MIENNKDIDEKKLYKDVFKVSDMIGKVNQINTDYNMFQTIYPFATENIDGYISQLDIKDKDILTVGSSGDQVLSSILYGCKSIKCIDINPYTKYYYELKKAAIKVLNYDEFLKFFCYESFNGWKNNRESFDYKLYLKISPYLNGLNKVFWDNLYLEFNGKLIRENLFSNDEYGYKTLKNTVPYLSEDNYYKLRKIIDNVEPSFNTQNIKDKIDGKYDYIFLSNIAKYLDCMYESDLLENFHSLISEMDNNLNDNGKILVAYLYNTNYYSTMYCNDWAVIYDLPSVKKLFKDIEMIDFRGIHGYRFNSKDRDSILVHEKELIKKL